MHITGIIAEYNPLHLGHQYHIEQTKALTGADYIITVLSGDFVQRGLPAIIDKHTRARLALEAGSDLVLELPVPYALSSGEGFGFGGVSLLHNLGCVDTLSFGTETGTLESLMPLARVLSEESSEYSHAYQVALKQGLSHPAARLKALSVCYPALDAGLLDGNSNNMLALEYCKALYRLNSTIQPVTVKRLGQGYLDCDMTAGGNTSETVPIANASGSTDAVSGFASATAIRNMLLQSEKFYVNKLSALSECTIRENTKQTNSLNTPSTAPLQEEYSAAFTGKLQDSLTPYTVNTLEKALFQNALLFPEDFSVLLHYRLLTLSEEALKNCWEVSPDLANKIADKLADFESFSQFAGLLWSKDLTYARVCRCLMHILLDIRQDTWDVHRSVPYARVLGFRRDSAPFLSAIKKHSCIPLITKLADAKRLLDSESYKLLNVDMQTAHIYDSVLQHKTGCKAVHEARKQIVIV